ncbi:MAG TPA: ABC transporter substrate-binding protein, partial [Opitutaceae bacterium]|nr:ABC transporter substrate-binding protein [Opitutaceae bacterium]
MKFTRLIACLIVFASLTALRPVLSADTLKIGYSDWPGYTAFEIANQKGWFKDAGVDVQMVWFDYGPSID